MSSCPGIDNLLINCIGLTKDDSVLLVYDSFCADIKHLLEKSCAEIGIALESHPMDNYDGIKLPVEIEKNFLDSQYPNIIVASQNSVWHTPARKKAKYELGKKIVSLIANYRHVYDGASIVDIDRMAILGKKLYQIFEKGKNVRIQTQSGTNVTAEIETPFLEDGLYRLPGTGGDFPPGEIGFGPLDGSVNGVIVYDIKIQYLGLV